MIVAVNYYHKELHLGCCSSPRSASVDNLYIKLVKAYAKVKTTNMIPCQILVDATIFGLKAVKLSNITIASLKSIY